MKRLDLYFAVALIVLFGVAVAKDLSPENPRPQYQRDYFDRATRSCRASAPQCGGVIPRLVHGVVAIVETPVFTNSTGNKLGTTWTIRPVITHGICDDQDDFESYCEAACAASGNGDQVCNVEFTYGGDQQWASCGQANSTGGCINTPSAECGVACIAS